MTVVNPIAQRELFDILKGKRSTWCLFAYVLLLSLAVYFAWPKTAEFLSVADQIARQIFAYFAFSQILLVAVLAPAFAAGSFTREKEEETFEILLTSPLSTFQIVLGKLQSAVTFLVIVIVASLPVAAVIVPLGGVGLDEVSNLYVILLVVASVSACIGLTCSSYFHRTHSALVVSYLIVLPLVSVLLAIASSNHRTFFAATDNVITLVVLGAIALAKMLWTLVGRTRREFLEPPRPSADEDTETQAGLVLRPGTFPDNLFLPEKSDECIADTDNPMFQKEIRSELLGSGTLFVRMVIQIGIFLSIFFIPSIVSGRTDQFFAYVTVVMCLIAPSLSSGLFSQERERHTLELLVTTMLTPREVVLGKIRAMIRYSLILAGFFTAAHVVTYAFSLRSMQAAWGSVMLTLTYVLVCLVAVISATLLAGFFSILTQSTFRATVGTYVALLIVYVGPFALVKLLQVYTSLSDSLLAWTAVTSPFGPLLLDPTSGILATRPSLWHGFVLFSGIMCLSLYRYVLKHFDSLMIREERSAQG